MIRMNDGLVIRPPNPMYVYVLIPPICRSQSSFVVRHCTFRPACSDVSQDHRSDRSWRPMVPTSRGDKQSESSHSPDRYRGKHHHQPTIYSRRRRPPATTQRRRDHYDRYHSSSEESNEYSQTEVYFKDLYIPMK
jgi:hypothetical protein